MTFLIIHGIGGHPGIHWQSWLKDQLELLGHKVLMPAMPNSNHPDRAEWLRTVRDLVRDDKSSLVIVGHSLGVATALDYIEQLPDGHVGFVSVSGFASDYDAELNSYFMKERIIDFNRVLVNLKKSVVVYADDDPYVTQEALKEVADKLGVEPTIVEGGGHLNSKAGFTEFPLLLELILSSTA